MDAFFARQPILDSQLRLYGYELLFRANPHSATSGSNVVLDGDSATGSVLSAMEWSGIKKATNKKMAFINFTERLLLEGVALLYPQRYLVVEVLEHIEIHDEIIAAIKRLKDKGYSIALDDYVFRERDSGLFPLCDIIKVEVDGSARSYENIRRIVQKVNLDNCKILAEKVESKEVYDQARALGCSLFQGYFFAKPVLVTGKKVNPLKTNQLRLINEISRPDIDFHALAKIIKSDIALTYRILQIANSPYYGLKCEAKNINQAVLMVGTVDIKKWLTFAALNNLCDDKPSELVLMSLIRAFFCEQLAQALGRPTEADAYFLAGLFSLLDALTDSSLAACLHDIPLASSTRKILLGKHQHDGDVLKLIIAIEYGDWWKTEQFCQKWSLDKARMTAMYMNAVHRAQQII